MANVEKAEGAQKPGADEVYCSECGTIIKKRAEICPECGVRQQQGQVQQNTSNLPDQRKYELQQVAKQNRATVILLAFLLTPVGYIMVDRKGLALINFLTFNYFLLGLIIVPIHCSMIIKNARKELRQAGVEGY